MPAVAMRRPSGEKAQALIDKPDEISEKRIEGLQDRWSGLPQPESRQMAEDLQRQFKIQTKALRERLKQQIDRRLRALEEASTLISELEKALQEGELKQALSLRDRARHRLKTAKGVADRKRAALQDRLHRTHPRIEYLTKWRHWGDRDAREHLCGDIERLADSALSPSEIAARVRNARESWKRIDRAEGPAAEDLWHRFDQACTRAKRQDLLPGQEAVLIIGQIFPDQRGAHGPSQVRQRSAEV